MKEGIAPIVLEAINPPHLGDPTIALALALLTIGIARDPRANGGETAEFRGEKAGRVETRFVFVLDPAGTDDVDTATWIARWDDAAWLAANPAHPFAAIRAFARSFENFGAWVKNPERHPVMILLGETEAQPGPQGSTSRSRKEVHIPADLLGTPRGDKLLAMAGLSA